MPELYVRWETIGGDKYHGRVVELDENVVLVECPDGVRRGVEEHGVVYCDKHGEPIVPGDLQ